jgi:molybdenum-dependent DNA-binding transcriptional regulator ModE
MLFDLTDLRLFIYIAELKSLTRSAERMHMSLPAASNRVKELEARFGTRLLYRENKGVHAAGRAPEKRDAAVQQRHQGPYPHLRQHHRCH